MKYKKSGYGKQGKAPAWSGNVNHKEHGRKKTYGSTRTC